jgi:hypothetical protein
VRTLGAIVSELAGNRRGRAAAKGR